MKAIITVGTEFGSGHCGTNAQFLSEKIGWIWD